MSGNETKKKIFTKTRILLYTQFLLLFLGVLFVLIKFPNDTANMCLTNIGFGCIGTTTTTLLMQAAYHIYEIKVGQMEPSAFFSAYREEYEAIRASVDALYGQYAVSAYAKHVLDPEAYEARDVETERAAFLEKLKDIFAHVERTEEVIRELIRSYDHDFYNNPIVKNKMPYIRRQAIYADAAKADYLSGAYEQFSVSVNKVMEFYEKVLLNEDEEGTDAENH